MKIHNFFQQETERARRSQVRWSMKIAGFSEVLFENLLRLTNQELKDWLSGRVKASDGVMGTLDLFWNMMQRFISASNCDEERLQEWIRFIPKNNSADPRVISPIPWAEMTLENYLIWTKKEGIEAVTSYMWSLKFGNCENTKLRHSNNPDLIYRLVANASKLDEKDRWLLVCAIARGLLADDPNRDAVLLDEDGGAFCYIIPSELRTDLLRSIKKY